MLALVATLGSFIVGFVQIGSMMQDVDDNAVLAGAYVGAGLAMLFRAAIAVIVIISLRQFVRWHATLPMQVTSTFD